MKKAILILPIILFILFESCNNDFNINAPYKNVYTLNCILRNNSPIQYAIISKNIYTENGAPPASTAIAQNIKGADVEINYNGSVYVMSDTTIQLTNSGNTIQVNCYYLKNLVLIPGKIISIKASNAGRANIKVYKPDPCLSSYILQLFPRVIILRIKRDII